MIWRVRWRTHPGWCGRIWLLHREAVVETLVAASVPRRDIGVLPIQFTAHKSQHIHLWEGGFECAHACESALVPYAGIVSCHEIAAREAKRGSVCVGS